LRIQGHGPLHTHREGSEAERLRVPSPHPCRQRGDEYSPWSVSSTGENNDSMCGVRGHGSAPAQIDTLSGAPLVLGLNDHAIALPACSAFPCSRSRSVKPTPSTHSWSPAARAKSCTCNETGSSTSRMHSSSMGLPKILTREEKQVPSSLRAQLPLTTRKGCEVEEGAGAGAPAPGNAVGSLVVGEVEVEGSSSLPETQTEHS
jgi:hypothetical protein